MTDPRIRIMHLRGEIPGLSPDEIAMALCDEDAANGEYEGCSTELELAYMQYENLAGGGTNDR